MPASIAATGLLSSSPATASTLLERFLDAYWLRPENAFWMTLRSEVLARWEFERPSLDLSCGDGLFSFLHAGGVLDPAFDVFQSVSHLDRVHSEQRDMFDHVRDDYQPPILTPVKQRIDTGTDLKQTLLTKAARLDLYERLVLHDSNTPLPFTDETFQTIYCNSAYWVANIEGFLEELRRIVRPGGRIILQVKLESLRRYTLERHRPALGDRFLEIIGRGRLESWPTVACRSGWERRFAAAGLVIGQAEAFVTGTHAHIWDIGLRPLAPMLVRLANGVTPATRAEVKRDWVSLLLDLLAPLCDAKLDLLPGSDEPAEMQYVLTR